MLRNRQWLLKSRPAGKVTAANFEYSEVEIPEPQLRPGQILVRNLVYAPAPTQRNWMNAPGRSYRAAIAVGSPITGAVMDNIAVHGRIAVCGQISAYDGEADASGPRDMMRVVYRRVRLQGFVLPDFHGEIELARSDLARWMKEGKLVHRQDLRHGFEQLPSSFLDLFSGANSGTLLVRVAASL